MILNLNNFDVKNNVDESLTFPKSSFKKFAQNADAYFQAVDSGLNKINPNDAIDVLSALVAFKGYFVNESKWEQLTLHLLNTLQKGIQKSIYDKIASFEGMTHVAYTINDLVSVAPKLKPFHENINQILLENLDAHLQRADQDKYYTKGNFEVIEGLSGPLSYLLQYENDNQSRTSNETYDMINRIVNVFIRRSKDTTILRQRVPGWIYFPSKSEMKYTPIDFKNGVINYGLSHGIAAPLVTLSMAYNSETAESRIPRTTAGSAENLINVINALIREFMSAYYYVENITYWPSRVSIEQYIETHEKHRNPTPMSWCYGSVSILRSLYVASTLTSNSEVKQFALKELVKIAEMPLANYRLQQMIVCHGFAGTAAILNAMHVDTDLEQFQRKALEMIEVCATMSIDSFFEHENRITREKHSFRQASLHSHLEGYNGVIQSTLSILKCVPNGNNKRLLISIR